MCGRYSLVDPKRIAARFQTSNDIPELQPNYNVAPGQVMPVITRNSPNKIELMRWGLVPSWAKDISIGYKMINARAETVAEKPSYREALKHQRCLVPATGFYEWKKVDGGKEPKNIHLKSNEMFAFAGLYAIWHDPEGNELRSYTIITTRPNKLMESIHDRMPVILSHEEEAEWLDSSITDMDQLSRLLDPYQENEMETYPVSSAVNNPKNNSELLLELAPHQAPKSSGMNSR